MSPRTCRWRFLVSPQNQRVVLAFGAHLHEVSGHFEHREAAMQQARFVIDDDLAKGNLYDHRLMDYNNDPRTTFADTQKFFRLLEERIANRLSTQQKESSSKR
jgi:hypothetical protein